MTVIKAVQLFSVVPQNGGYTKGKSMGDAAARIHPQQGIRQLRVPAHALKPGDVLAVQDYQTANTALVQVQEIIKEKGGCFTVGVENLQKLLL